jgi:hypothetical protein
VPYITILTLFTRASLVYRVVYIVLLRLVKLYKELVNLLKNTILDKIVDNLKQYPFFADCIRALNSTYLLVTI